MRKNILFLMVGIMSLSMLTGCTGKASKYLPDVNYDKYIDICEYKGVPARKIVFEISEEEVQDAIMEEMYEYATYDEITDRGIEVGDYANIDYKATMDGKEVEDYSGSDEDILVGEGYLSVELEDALVGMKTGESKKIELELTEEYAAEEDIGKKISYDVKVNQISVENLPNYNEDFLKKNTKFDSTKKYEDSIKKRLKKEKEEEYKYVTAEEIIDSILANSKFDGYPEEIYKECEETYDNDNAYYASIFGMELDEYLEAYGIDEKTKKQDIEELVQEELVIGMISKKEKIDCTEKEIDAFIEDIYGEYGYNSVDEFLVDYTKEEVGYQVVYEKVLDFLYKNAKYNEISEEDYLKEVEEEEEEVYLEDEIEGESVEELELDDEEVEIEDAIEIEE